MDLVCFNIPSVFITQKYKIYSTVLGEKVLRAPEGRKSYKRTEIGDENRSKEIFVLK